MVFAFMVTGMLAAYHIGNHEDRFVSGLLALVAVTSFVCGTLISLATKGVLP